VTKKGKKWLVWTLAVLAFVVAGTAWFAYLLTSEHPDYVRAAAELPDARKRAEAKFGPLDWAGYRKEKGIQEQDDREAWRSLKNSIPKELIDWQMSTSKDEADFAGIFRRNREWFLSLEEAIRPLALQHLYKAEFNWADYEPYSNAKSIEYVCYAGIVGAALEGEVESFTSIVRAVLQVVSKVQSEMDVWTVLLTRAACTRLSDALVTASVLSNNERIRATALDLHPNPYVPSSATETYAGEARNYDMTLETLRELTKGDAPASEIEQLMDSNGYQFYVKEPSSVERLVHHVLNGFDDEEPRKSRRVGPHTPDALEARLLQVLCEMDDMQKKYANNPLTFTSKATLLGDRIEKSRDRSYEFAIGYADELFVQGATKDEFRHNAALACLRTLARYPRLSDIPAVFDQAIRPVDPFTGNTAIFKKTPKGFFFSTVGFDKVDESALITPNDVPGASFRRFGTDDWAYVVTFP
jgi:hypothetical protein